jgi:hypothetical protein
MKKFFGHRQFALQSRWRDKRREWGYNAGPMPPEDEIQYEIDMIADEPSDQKYPTLNDINYFLHDLNLLYDLTRVLLDPKYENVRITQHFE